MNSFNGRYTIVAIVMLILVVINVISVFSVVEGPNTSPVPADEAPIVEPTTEAELIRGVGGLTSVGGLGILFTTFGLAATSVGLLMKRHWEMGAMFFLGADIFFKLMNFVSQFTILEFTSPNVLFGIGLMVIEGVLILVLYSLWRRRNAESPVMQQQKAS